MTHPWYWVIAVVITGNIKEVVTSYVTILQIQEWQSMLFLINSQRGRPDAEVLYNFNSEENV